MQPVVGCDAHKKFSVFVSVDQQGNASPAIRVEHDRNSYGKHLRTLPDHSEIAVEATSHGYRIVDAMEQAGRRPHLANPFEAKRHMGKTNKTDALDAKGLAILLRNGTLPESWIPPSELRHKRELLRTRMALRDLRRHQDLFGKKGRAYVATTLNVLLPRRRGWSHYNSIQSTNWKKIAATEIRIADQLRTSRGMGCRARSPTCGQFSLSSYGWRSAMWIVFEEQNTWSAIPDWFRASSPSGERIRHGGTSRNVNLFLKWGFVEATKCAVRIKAHRDH